MPVLAAPAILLIAVAAALLALLLVYALNLFVKAVSAILPDWHIPLFGSIRGFVVNAASGAANTISSYASSSLGAIYHLFADPAIWAWHMFDIVYQAVYETSVTVAYVFTTAIPRAITIAYNYAQAAQTAAVNHANGLYNQIYATALSWYNSAVAHADALYNSIYATALNWYNTAINHANGLYNQIYSIALTQYNAAIANANNLYNQTYARATDLYNRAVSYIDAKTGEVTSYVNTQIANTVAHANAVAAAAETAAIQSVVGPLITDLPGLWNQVISATDEISDAAAGAFQDVTSLVKGIPRSVPLTAGAALASSLALSTALSRLAADCTIPNCRNLSGFGRDIQALFGLVEDAAFLALIAEFLTNPAGAADEARTIVVPLINGAIGAAENLIGV